MNIQLTEEQIHDLRRHFQAMYESLVNGIIRPLIRIWPVLKSMMTKLLRLVKSLKVYPVRPHKRSTKRAAIYQRKMIATRAPGMLE